MTCQHWKQHQLPLDHTNYKSNIMWLTSLIQGTHKTMRKDHTGLEK